MRKWKICYQCVLEKTCSDMYTNFTSFILLEYKVGLSYTFFHWCLVSNFFQSFTWNLKNLRKLFQKMLTNRNLQINTFLYFWIKYLNISKKLTMVPKKEFIIVFPYLGNMLNIKRTRLLQALNKKLKFCQLKVLF